MSYQKLNTVVTFNWVMRPVSPAPAEADIDVILTKPDGTETYAPSAAVTYVAPTATTQGRVTYQATVDQTGRWRALLVIGTSDAYDVNNRKEIYCVDPPSHVVSGPTPDVYLGPAVIPPGAP